MEEDDPEKATLRELMEKEVQDTVPSMEEKGSVKPTLRELMQTEEDVEIALAEDYPDINSPTVESESEQYSSIEKGPVKPTLRELMQKEEDEEIALPEDYPDINSPTVESEPEQYSSIGEEDPEPLLLQSPDGHFYVEDEDGMYEILEYIGDVTPVCQVFRARYTKLFHGEIAETQVVALKLARNDLYLREFFNMRKEVENSFKIGANEDQENNVIQESSRILGIYKYFMYRAFYCVSMPYIRAGSLRFLVNARIWDRKLPEICIAVVLRETLHALSILHRRGKVHGKLNAGNIFLDQFDGLQPPALKLAYEGSTYYHRPETEVTANIWERAQGGLGILFCVVSRRDENRFWTERGIYEPNISGQVNLTPASDIWNFGVTALELALGPLSATGPKRTPEELRAFLTRLHNNHKPLLPPLSELFFAPETTQAPQRTTFLPHAKSTAGTGTSTAPKAGKGLVAAGMGVVGAAGMGHMVATGMGMVAASEKFKSTFVEKIKGKRKKRILNEFSRLFTAMVKSCLVVEPDQRPTAEMLLNDAFFLKYRDVNMEYFAEVLRSQDVIVGR